MPSQHVKITSNKIEIKKDFNYKEYNLNNNENPVKTNKLRSLSRHLIYK